MDSFLPVSIEELQHHISPMNNKSSLLDPAPVSLIKECSEIIFPILQLIVNTVNRLKKQKSLVI